MTDREKRETMHPRKEKLTLEVIKATEARTSNVDSDRYGFAVLCLLTAVLCMLPTLLTRHFFLWPTLGAIAAAAVAVAMICSVIKRRQLASIQYQNRSVRIEAWLVKELESVDFSGPGDDTADIHYYLHLLQESKSWKYECAKAEYKQFREGDTAYLVYRYGILSPVFVFNKENWILSEDILTLMPKEGEV